MSALLEMARIELARRRAAGELKRLNPVERSRADVIQAAKDGRSPSLAKALRAYFYDDLLLEDNKNDPETRRELLADYKAYLKKYKGQPLRRSINSICYDCVGGHADPAPSRRIQCCGCTDCPLHPVRPTKGITHLNNLDPDPKSLPELSIKRLSNDITERGGGDIADANGDSGFTVEEAFLANSDEDDFDSGLGTHGSAR